MMKVFNLSVSGLTKTKLSIVLTSLLLVTSFQNCSPANFTANEDASNNETSVTPTEPTGPTEPTEPTTPVNPDIPTAPATCVFNDRVLRDGQSITTFLNSSEPFGTSCKSETRVCTNGVLSGSYAYATCEVGAPKACLFNGQTIAHGDTVKAYQNSSVAYGQTCSEEVRKCDNGTLSGSFAFASCDIGAPLACLFNGQTIAHGASVVGFLASSVDFGKDCSKENRVCNNGSLSGSYAYGSCSIGAPKACLFNGQTVAHGQTVTAYQTSSVGFGNTCGKESRTCNNGTLTGSYTFASCSVGSPASCLFNGQTIAHGQSVVAYKASSAAVCEKETRTCSNGTLTGSYGYNSCEVPCSVPSETTKYLNSVIQIFNGESVQAIAQNCIDSAVPTLALNMPTDAVSTMRFKNTCGNRYCVNKKGMSAGRVIDMGNGVASLECRYEKTPSTYVGACTKEVERVGTPLKMIADVKQSVLNSSCSDSNPVNAATMIRFFYTCGFRYCSQRGYADGRVVEANGNDVGIHCYSDFMGSIVTLQPAPNAVAAACVDGSYPSVASNLPGTDLATERFQSTCGNRYCVSQGYASGHVVEYNPSATVVKCLKK
jgi:hypothetical protein